MALASSIVIEQHGILLENNGILFKENAWEVEHLLITKLYHNKSALNLNFRVYNRQGRNGPARLWKFEDPVYKKPRRPKKKK